MSQSVSEFSFAYAAKNDFLKMLMSGKYHFSSVSITIAWFLDVFQVKDKSMQQLLQTSNFVSQISPQKQTLKRKTQSHVVACVPSVSVGINRTVQIVRMVTGLTDSVPIIKGGD